MTTVGSGEIAGGWTGSGRSPRFRVGIVCDPSLSGLRPGVGYHGPSGPPASPVCFWAQAAPEQPGRFVAVRVEQDATMDSLLAHRA